jgi:hypothetical protein
MDSLGHRHILPLAAHDYGRGEDQLCDR